MESAQVLKISPTPPTTTHPSLYSGTYSHADFSGPTFERVHPHPEDEGAAEPHERLLTYHFHSAILPDDRCVCVYLPPQYATEPDRRFPVFYLHDGQNLFDPRTSYIPGRTWRAGSTADWTNETGRAEPLILVGIANTGLRRMAEYTPTRDFRMGGGDGARYGRLLTEELKPFLDETFRTLPAREHTGVGGSSLGGLISLYLGLEHPDIFSRLGVLSPSIWWNQRSILANVADARPKPDLRIWLDIGTAEGGRHVRDTEFLARMLEKQGWKSEVDLHFEKIDGGVHDEDAWADRFHRVLSFLFPPAFESTWE
jgi:predicted alpha/beta superfamily hydrolase